MAKAFFFLEEIGLFLVSIDTEPKLLPRQENYRQEIYIDLLYGQT